MVFLLHGRFLEHSHQHGSEAPHQPALRRWNCRSTPGFVVYIQPCTDASRIMPCCTGCRRIAKAAPRTTLRNAPLFGGGCRLTHSMQAVPFWEMLQVLALWFCISVPMVFLGAYFGYRKAVEPYPVVTSNIPRQVREIRRCSSVGTASAACSRLG